MLIIGVFYIILITELITEKKTHSTKVHITKLNLIYLEKWEKTTLYETVQNELFMQ